MEWNATEVQYEEGEEKKKKRTGNMNSIYVFQKVYWGISIHLAPSSPPFFLLSSSSFCHAHAHLSLFGGKKPPSLSSYIPVNVSFSFRIGDFYVSSYAPFLIKASDSSPLSHIQPLQNALFFQTRNPPDPFSAEAWINMEEDIIHACALIYKLRAPIEAWLIYKINPSDIVAALTPREPVERTTEWGAGRWGALFENGSVLYI